MSNTILLKGDIVREEFEAAAGITPGHVVELTSAEKAQVHATAGGNVAPVRVSLENDLEGEGIDDAYVATDRVQTGVFRPGDQFNAILTTSQTVTKGVTLVESAGNGRVRAHVVDSGAGAQLHKQIIGLARETKTTTGSVARLIVEAV